MKITEVKTWLVEGLKYNWVLIKIETDEGLTGIGEATKSPIVELACSFVGTLLKGKDPTRTDNLWTKLITT